MQTAYRMPRTPMPPGGATAGVPLDPVSWMNVKSLITRPGRNSMLAAGTIEVHGIAWTGAGHVTGVEVRIDRGGRWMSASLLGDAEQGAWRPWRFSWEPARPGRHVIEARATDSMGQVQPETPAWNRSGYLWNGFDAVECQVR
jgi:Mo-co oxidoreductase dimerisation domain